MSQPADESQVPSIATVAAESPEESVEKEKEAVGGEQPDVGGTVPTDDAQ
jgi:hypothetical protein